MDIASLITLLIFAGSELPHDDIAQLLPEVSPITDHPVTSISAAQHHKALAAHPDNGKSYWLQPLRGEPLAPRWVFFIPQYHRDDTVPVAWTTLGREIREVQERIDGLIQRLAVVHGTLCLGSEGNIRDVIPYSSELRQLADWRGELMRGKRAVLLALAGDSRRAQSDLDTITRVLDTTMRETAIYYDGVGAAQNRLKGRIELDRFGIEDPDSNQEALALLRQLREIERELATLDPGSQPDEVGVLGQMWLDEYPTYEAQTLIPLQQSLERLDTLRLQLRSEESADAADAVVQFSTRARRIIDGLIRPDEVATNIAYYRELDRIVHVGDSENQARQLTKAQQRRRKHLTKMEQQVSSKFARVSQTHRERVAANKVIERMIAKNYQSCIVVMGAGHQEGLPKALAAAAKAKKIGPFATIVLTPFGF